jgi:hypothetical protein
MSNRFASLINDQSPWSLEAIDDGSVCSSSENLHRPGRTRTQRIHPKHFHPSRTAFHGSLFYGLRNEGVLRETRFHASNGFGDDFKTPNGFRPRRTDLKRRPTIDSDVGTTWMDVIQSLLKTTNREPILNADETIGRSYPEGTVTWAEVGAEGVPVQVTGDVKRCVTVLATITADMRKLPLVIPATGKTEMVEVSDHSLSGWTTSATFCRYLRGPAKQCSRTRNRFT